MRREIASEDRLVKLLIILVLLLVILIGLLIKSYGEVHTTYKDNQEDDQVYQEVSTYLEQEDKQLVSKEDEFTIKITIINLNKIRMALLFYLADHKQLPNRLTDLVGDYLIKLPVETTSNINQVSNNLDFTGGWYYNKKKFKLSNLFLGIEQTLRPNVLLPSGYNLNFKPYKVIINRKQHRLYLVCQEEKVKSYPVAVGASNTPTPTGEFRIKTKQKLSGKEEKIYGQYWIGLDLWTLGGGYGIHGTVNNKLEITKQRSKGCIRMRKADLEELYRILPLKTKVIIN